MTVNNVDIIKPLISNCKEGEFYVLHIFHRGKDGKTKYEPADKKISVQTVKTYYVSTPEYLDYKMPEIMDLCELFNARAYINLNKKSWKQVSLKSLELIARNISNEEYNNLKSLVDTACGQTGACDKGSSWIVDLDTKNEAELEKLKKCVNECQSGFDDNIIAIVPTLHGYHLITHPFNPKQFSELYQAAIDIHKNSPTLLYYKEQAVKK